MEYTKIMYKDLHKILNLAINWDLTHGVLEGINKNSLERAKKEVFLLKFQKYLRLHKKPEYM